LKTMRTWQVMVVAAAFFGCGSDITPPGPGRADDVQSIRLFDGAGTDRTEHIFLFRSDTLHLDVRMYAADGHQITSVSGGVDETFTFTPDSVAQSIPAPTPDQPLRRSVFTSAAVDTPGSLTVTLLFLQGGIIKTFGPFGCLVHP